MEESRAARAAAGAPNRLVRQPRQSPVQKSPFHVSAGKIDYLVQPLFKYELHGMVVSRHDSDTWWDYIHKEWDDWLNIADLCVVWGNNVRSGAYRDIEFSSGQFVCNFQTSSNEAFAAFDQSAISNNHLLSADPSLARRMRNVRIGDQVRFSGYLAEYSHNQGFPFKRGTSTVRTDSGNGACETVYVEGLRDTATLWWAVAHAAVGRHRTDRRWRHRMVSPCRCAWIPDPFPAAGTGLPIVNATTVPGRGWDSD